MRAPYPMPGPDLRPRRHLPVYANGRLRALGHHCLVGTNQAAMTEQWPIDEDLITTHSRRNEPLLGVFQTCMISMRFANMLDRSL